ncbi:hypothetical protein L1049_016192 [Liquidambar formosana]|uniref:Uncharacterized protein n=1 Tax=Liquidambar formosana TaxID=63359 RepID=A0AAP0X2P8_LIQFO
MRAVGNNAQASIIALGVIARNKAPIQCTKWRAIPDDDKKTMWQEAKEELRRLESEEGDAPMTEDDRFEAVLGPERSA